MSEHLQPDSFSAFIEGVLPEHERLECLAHLAECGQCREVVYLAQEPVPAQQVPVPRAKRWFRPIWALGAAAAAGVLVLSVALYRIEKPATLAPVAMVSAPPASVLDEPRAAAPAATAKRAAKPIQHLESAAAPPSPSALVLSRPGDTLAAPPASVLNNPRAAAPAAVPGSPLPLPKPEASDAMQINGSVSVDSGVAGTVKDVAGGVIPRATITLHQFDGANSFIANTDPAGQFQIDGLPPGRYEIKVAAPGFLAATKQLEVKPAQVSKADSTLSVGSTAQTVEVTASAPAVITQSTPASALPVFGRMIQRNAPVIEAQALPSKLPAVTTVKNGEITLTADSSGALFLSQNAGQKWKAIKRVWHGKVSGLEISGGLFRLTTDAGAVWLSRDGTRWSLEKN